MTLWAGFLVFGCASPSGSIQRLGPARQSPVAGRSLVLLETRCENSANEAERRLLQALVGAGLQQSGRFSKIVSTASAFPRPEMKVLVVIKDLKKVSDSARLLWGDLAGQAGIATEVQVDDLIDATRITSFQAFGKSSTGWDGAGTTDQALQKAAEQIVAELIKIP